MSMNHFTVLEDNEFMLWTAAAVTLVVALIAGVLAIVSAKRPGRDLGSVSASWIAENRSQSNEG
jgi:hypothetical protein